MMFLVVIIHKIPKSVYHNSVHLRNMKNLHENIGMLILTSELPEVLLLSCSHLHIKMNLILPYSLYVIVRLTITMPFLIRY